MKQAHFRFYAGLNDFLPAERRAGFLYSFSGSQSVKHLIEAAGVPHTEVDLLLVNGRPVDFSYVVNDGDRVSVYPVFTAFDVSSLSLVKRCPPSPLRFVLDAHLGRLAAYLRMLGFDTLYRGDYSDRELSRLAAAETRVLLTRDRGLLMRSSLAHGCYIRETDPRRQLKEVLQRFDLWASISPFARCMRCNARLAAVAREAVIDRVPPRSRAHCQEFRQCPGCGRVYWNGSHYRRMQRLILEITENLQGGSGSPLHGRAVPDPPENTRQSS
jgi:uncharacterized protein with PIN domain